MSRRAFTLIELLVVVGIIAVLMAILLPSLSRAKEAARRAVCASNLHAQGQAIAIYASFSNDLLPIFNVPPGYACTPHWWWDQSRDFTDAMLAAAQRGSTGSLSPDSVRKIFFCPSNADQNTRNAQDIWNFSSFNNYSVFGYAWLNDRGNGPDGIPNTSDDQAGPMTAKALPFFNSAPAATRTPPLRLVRKWSANAFAARTELAFDAIISPDVPATRWDRIVGGYTVNGYLHRTTHMDRGKPSGGNFLCCDGHVEWRKFSQNTPSAAIPIPTDGGPYFWVPNP